MGPAATIRLYEEITARTPVQTDQDHIPLVIESNPAIPDRTEALLGGGPDPLPAMLESLRRLMTAGVDFIAIACNTAHAWYPQIAAATTVPVLHLIHVAAEACRACLPEGASVGVLATTGAIATELYQNALTNKGLRPALPSQSDQAQVMRTIRLVKAGGTGNLQEARQVASLQAQRLIDQGAKAILLGCTDLSVILRDGDLPVPVIDSTVALADKIIALARGDAPLEVQTWT